jgi:hypothetical protein
MRGRISLGHGHSMELSEEAMRALLRHPSVVAAVMSRAQDICDAANALAIHVGRPERPDPEYSVSLQNSTAADRPRARVYPANYQAVLDEAMHSTLFKAMNVAPSEPLSGESAIGEDTPLSPGWGVSRDAELSVEGEAGAP